MSEHDHTLRRLHEELKELDRQRQQLVQEITNLEQQNIPHEVELPTPPHESEFFTKTSSPQVKINLYRSLFKGRRDVFPRRFESQKTGRSGYQPVCENEWKTGICEKPRIKCSQCSYRKFVPVNDDIVRWHLQGQKPGESKWKDYVIGVYPMLEDETCWFLAADFDKKTWQEDVKAFLATCIELDVPVALEKSRSGNGAHAWFFFSEPISCALARKLGSWLLTETMDRRPEIGFESYDRLFPNQDTMPQGGFGNLIALPLQRRSRENGNSVFVDENLNPWFDQWSFLSHIRRISRQQVESLISQAEEKGRITGVSIPVLDDDTDKPWELPPSRKVVHLHKAPLPSTVNITLSNQIYIEKESLSPSLKNQIIRIAAFQNPEFYRKQSMRMPVYSVPRVISCAEDFPNHIALPRGCLDELLAMFKELGIQVGIDEKRKYGDSLSLAFQGTLTPEQLSAAQALAKHDIGVLSAPTAFGKTVLAAWLIAHRHVNTLILVHRRQLLDQWTERMKQFLDLATNPGTIGGGKRSVTGIIDIAIIQSLVKKGTVDDLVANYGHHPIIFMNCGPVRHRVCPKVQAAERPFDHQVIIHDTHFKLPPSLMEQEKPSITDVYSALIHDKNRNKLIIREVLKSLQESRTPIVLTERREHLEILDELLKEHGVDPVVLRGGLGKKMMTSAMKKLEEKQKDSSVLILATGKYLGEGFDYAPLDTLFLTLPVSWKGTIAQYAGRLHRLYYDKKQVIVHDYSDSDIPMLSRMLLKRIKGLEAIGYSVQRPGEVQHDLFSEK